MYVAEQFHRSMAGDRFFFTHKGQTGSFTRRAREILLKRTFSAIICENTKIIAVPEKAFFNTNPSEFIDCSETPSLEEIEELLKIGTD